MTVEAGGLAPRLPSIDGLRGVAVLLVIAFHLDLAGVMDGGFLGVDVFFTISGFLITSLLLREQARAGRLAWRAFLVRRMQRLFPAGCAMIGIAAAVTLAFYPDAAQRTQADLPAAWTFSSNWWQLASQQSYFEAQGRPPVLQHMWSVAVEEQFYLVWPLVLIVLARPGRARLACAAAIALAAASAWWMAALFQQDPGAEMRNRLYLGTDTHAAGLLVGAALGCLCARLRLLDGRTAPPGAAAVTDVAGLAAFIALAWAAATWNEGSPVLYEGGFAIVALCTALVIFASADRYSPLAWLLRNPLLQWAGTRSYSLYLWHWPIFVWLRHPAEAGQRSLPATLAELVLVAVAAEVSYRLLERRTERAVHTHASQEGRVGWLVATVLAAVLLQADGGADSRLAGVDPPAVVHGPIAGPQPRPSEFAEYAPASGQVEVPVEADAGAVTVAFSPRAADQSITVVGDSVMLGAKPYLGRLLGAEVDAVVGRQFQEGREVLRRLRTRGALAPVVVVHLGTNGYILESHARELLRSLQDRRLVLLVDVHAKRRWTEPNNAIIERVAAAAPNAQVVRWTDAARDHPEYFVQDGIHLTGAGMAAITRAIADAAGLPMQPLRLVADPKKVSRTVRVASNRDHGPDSLESAAIGSDTPHPPSEPGVAADAPTASRESL